ncbi:hypothetical protein [Pedobacter africanus]|uniref:Uncharacterized protein n=1 Tax=Pedobacter africanus TaxID=151894 RepID=A0A1W2BZ47_9SPHI|nr:hypothetical protein [Pedobacter africanus]SMC78199.1 hypothetical protein SAMN04488524_2770 [Pedobacter africanus]
MKNNVQQVEWMPILITTIIAGTLDITAACINAWLSNDVMPGRVLAYIASGVWGKTAYNGGPEMMFFGLLFHYIIVFFCVFCFFWLYSRWSFLHRSMAVNAVLIAFTAWLVTTQLVLRMSKITVPPFRVSGAIIAIAILIICLGFPIAYAARRFIKSSRPMEH